MNVNGQQQGGAGQSVVSQITDILTESATPDGVGRGKKKHADKANDDAEKAGETRKRKLDGGDDNGKGRAEADKEKQKAKAQNGEDGSQDVGTEDEADPIVTPMRRDDDDDAGATDTDRDEDDSDDDGALDFDKLADELGVKRKHLYGLKVPLGNGQFASIGELKDSFVTAEALETRKVEVEDAHHENLRAQMRAQQELSEVIRMLPPIKPEMLEKARASLDGALQQEFNALRKYLPEWADKGARAALQERHLKRLSQWGIGKADYNSITDHRVIRFIHDADRAFAKLEKAIAINQGREVPTGHKTTTRTSSAHKQEPHTGPAKTTAEAVSRIGKLLKD